MNTTIKVRFNPQLILKSWEVLKWIIVIGILILWISHREMVQGILTWTGFNFGMLVFTDTPSPYTGPWFLFVSSLAVALQIMAHRDINLGQKKKRLNAFSQATYFLLFLPIPGPIYFGMVIMGLVVLSIVQLKMMLKNRAVSRNQSATIVVDGILRSTILTILYSIVPMIMVGSS